MDDSRTKKVTRFEVIDETGRVLVRRDVSVILSLQDDDRTLKVFLKQAPGSQCSDCGMSFMEHEMWCRRQHG